MRYELDANGYVLNVFWGCHSGNCAEYTGTVPYGYTNLNDWSENALINAYYIENGNLVLDPDKLADLEIKVEQEAIDNEHVLRKDLYGTSEILNSQYQSETATGKILAIDNVKKINPTMKITNIKNGLYRKLDILTQSKNMLRNDAITETISGIKFTKNNDDSITINGTSTKEIEYNLSGSSTNTTPIFMLKKDLDYYFNIDDLDCEMKFYDGTTSQVYTGASGLINLVEDKEVTQVLIKIPAGTTINKTIYPQLEFGDSASGYQKYNSRKLTINFDEYAILYPSEDLYPSDDIYPNDESISIDYIFIENGNVYISVNGVSKHLTKGNVNLFNGFNTVYTLQDTNIEMKYYMNVLDVDSLEFLQGKSTTTNKFKILEDGSIEAHNGYFSGELNADSGEVGGWTINNMGLTNGKVVLNSDGSSTIYTVADLVIIRNYVMGVAGFELPPQMIKHYDLNGDGVVNSQDYVLLQNLIGISMK